MFYNKKFIDPKSLENMFTEFIDNKDSEFYSECMEQVIQSDRGHFNC